MKHGYEGTIWIPVRYAYSLPHQDSLEHTGHVLRILSYDGEHEVVDHYSHLINYKDRAYQPGTELEELEISEIKQIQVTELFQASDYVNLYSDLVYVDSPFWVDVEPVNQVSLAWNYCDWQVDIYQTDAEVEEVISDAKALSRIVGSVVNQLDERQYDLTADERIAHEEQMEQLIGYGNMIEPMMRLLLDRLANKQVVIVQTCTD